MMLVTACSCKLQQRAAADITYLHHSVTSDWYSTDKPIIKHLICMEPAQYKCQIIIIIRRSLVSLVEVDWERIHWTLDQVRTQTDWIWTGNGMGCYGEVGTLTSHFCLTFRAKLGQSGMNATGKLDTSHKVAVIGEEVFTVKQSYTTTTTMKKMKANVEFSFWKTPIRLSRLDNGDVHCRY